ncbi:MAG: ribosome maturation factor RimM [Candidatus Caenarcaniphilales bacterium]|nr:ribosome maturation factor RimM [Candidatus Caenarcaniphilales bacterium]
MDHKPDLVWIGRFLRPHGLQGQIKTAINLPANLHPNILRELYTRQSQLPLVIESLNEFYDYWLIKLNGIETPEQAKALSNIEFSVDRQALGELPESEFYIDQLIGLEVRRSEDDQVVGMVTNMLNLSFQPVLEIEKPDSKRFMVPFVDRYVDRISIQEIKIWLKDLHLFEGF